MLADDFFGAEPFDALRTTIPGEDVPFRVELKNGVVDDRIDQLNKAAFTLNQTFPSLIGLSTVGTEFQFPRLRGKA
jgi:hypothetical protein